MTNLTAPRSLMIPSNSMEDALKAFLAANPDLPDSNQEENITSTQNEDIDKDKKSMRLDVVLEKKHRAGKQATIITGFEGSDEELLKLAAMLKKRLATGGSARGGEILIQGDRRQQVLEILRSAGYKARII